MALTTVNASQNRSRKSRDPEPYVDLSWQHASRTSTGKHTAAVIDLKREGQYRTVLVYWATIKYVTFHSCCHIQE